MPDISGYNTTLEPVMDYVHCPANATSFTDCASRVFPGSCMTRGLARVACCKDYSLSVYFQRNYFGHYFPFYIYHLDSIRAACGRAMK